MIQVDKERLVEKKKRGLLTEKSLAVKEIDIGWMRKRGWVREIG